MLCFKYKKKYNSYLGLNGFVPDDTSGSVLVD